MRPRLAQASIRRGASRGLAALLLGLCACGLSARDTYDVRGVVEGLERDELQIRIAHEPIPGLMPAMTMSFDVASEELLRGVEPGMQVRFRLERNATVLRITAIEVEGRVEAPLAATPTAEAPEPTRAPPFALIDQAGRPLALADLRGTAVLLDFVFTRCTGPCPILTAARVSLQRRLPPPLAGRVHFVSISVDPVHDTPARLREYADERGADLSGWSFLTGDREVVADVLRDYGAGTPPEPGGTPEHVVVSFLIDPAGRIVRRYPGLRHTEGEILADLEEVLAEPRGAGPGVGSAPRRPTYRPT